MLSSIRHFLARHKAQGIKRWRELRPSFLQWQAIEGGNDLMLTFEQSNMIFDEHRLRGISDDRALALFGLDSDWRLKHDRIAELRGAIVIEPAYGLASLPNRRLFDWTQNVHSELEPRRTNPPRRSEVIDVAALVHLDTFLGRNLWHFYAEGVNPLLLLLRQKVIDARIPVLIHRQVWDRPYTKEVYSRPEFRDVNFLIQEPHQWIRTERLIKASTGRDGFLYARDALAQPHPTGKGRRIFLDRRPNFGRSLANADELARALSLLGFDRVFAEDLSYSSQMTLFAQAELVIGCHGAGLTNLIYSLPRRLGVIELQTRSYVKPHYYWLTRTLGTSYYDVVIGSRLDWQERYVVPTEQVLATAESMIEQFQ